MKRFFIDESYNQQWGLQGNELLVYAALRALCANPSHSWKGSNQELANESHCGSRQTAKRSVTALIRRGLVTVTSNCFTIVQIGRDDVQNGRENVQNGPYFKERTKEKGYNINNKENFGRNYSFSPPATEQQQAHYAGSQYAAYLQRKQNEKRLEQIRQANDETKTVSFDDYKKSK